MLRFLGRAGALLSLLFLAACTGAPLMGLEISDYRETFNFTGDQQILVNILRAKDNAPLHFSELQTLGASNQFNAGVLATEPIGFPHGLSSPASITGNAGAQTSPLFSLSSLELQQFTQGLINPVGPSIIQQLFEEGVDQRLILLLFVSAISVNGVTYYNSTKCDRAGDPADCNRPFYKFLSEIDRLADVPGRKIVAHTYVELAPIGTSLPWSSASIRDMTSVDPNKYSIEPDPADRTKAIVYSVSEQRLALCYYVKTPDGQARYFPVLSGGDYGICTRDRVYARANRFREQWRNGLVIRSTYQIIQYLGQILKLQENVARGNADRCIKLRDEPATERTCEAGDVFFQVNPTREPPLVKTVFNGASYSVGIGACNPEYCDHSAEVLKIVNLLININKNAANIPQVPIVRVVQ